MFDWHNTFNIVFISVAASLVLFFLVVAVVVAVTGKRKCNAFDMFVRTFASLAMVVSAMLVLCAVFLFSSGNWRIDIQRDAVTNSITSALLILNGRNSITFPSIFNALFELLLTGAGMVTALVLISSMAALIVDCLIANKKEEKAEKSAEQIKLEAELDRIRKMGEAAVTKTNAAARHAESSAKREQALAHDGETDSAEPDFDWRTDAPEQSETDKVEFVGIKKENTQSDADDGFTDDFESDGDVDIGVDGDGESEPETVADNFDRYGDGEDDGRTEFDDISQTKRPEREYAEEEYFDESIGDEPSEPIESVTDEQSDDAATDNAYDDMSAWAYDGENTDGATEDEISGSVDDIGQDSQPMSDKVADDSIEPYRDIYIPTIRTIVKPSEQGQQTAPKKSDPVKRKQSNNSVAPKTMGATKSAASDKRAKQTANKPTVNKQPTRQNVKKDVSPEKKLPVTRRYVILDRHNAVNMFGEYLKERESQAKDKLKSSINTIIIE